MPAKNAETFRMRYASWRDQACRTADPPDRRNAAPNSTVVGFAIRHLVAAGSCIAIWSDMRRRAICTAPICRTRNKHGYDGIHTWNSHECESTARFDFVMLSMELMHTETLSPYPRGNARRTAGGTMPDIDIAWLITEFDGLGLKLTATPRFDGSFGLNRWRTMSYWDNAAQAESLWAEHIGDDPEIIAAIATHIGASGIANGKVQPNAPLHQPS
jgi:hypothetical protein